MISRKLRKEFKGAMGEASFFLGLQRREGLLQALNEAINGPFGAALILALENIEGAAFGRLLDTSQNGASLAQARAEIKVAQYMKASLLAHVQELESLKEMISEMNNEEDSYDDTIHSTH